MNFKEEKKMTLTTQNWTLSNNLQSSEKHELFVAKKPYCPTDYSFILVANFEVWCIVLFFF